MSRVVVVFIAGFFSPAVSNKNRTLEGSWRTLLISCKTLSFQDHNVIHLERRIKVSVAVRNEDRDQHFFSENL